MIAEELVPLLPAIARRLAPGGTLVTSGQLEERRAEFEEALRVAGFEPRARQAEGEWIGFVARRT
jgi:ribosomal protein L11 methylase PrmA